MKNIIITGAANGIGKAIAKLLKDNNLILIDEDEDNLKKLANSLKASYYVCDVANEKDIREIFTLINREHKKIDCLINSAVDGLLVI